MFRFKNKAYYPTPLMTKISIAMLIIAWLLIESAQMLLDMVLPIIMIVVFGYVVMVDACHE